MFVGWYSSDGRRGFGCCAVWLILPFGLLTLFSDRFAVSWTMLLLGLALVALLALVVVPALTRSSEKRKNEELGEKPKRTESRYALGDDGELIEVVDDTAPESPREDDARAAR